MPKAAHRLRWILSLATAVLLAGQVRAEVGIVTEAPGDDVQTVKTDRGWMVPYTETIPGTDATFEMVPVAGGFVHQDVGAEGEEPALVEVELPPYWIGKTEVTWAEYRPYMDLNQAYAQIQQLATLEADGDAAAAIQKAPHLAKKLSMKRAVDAATIEVDAVTAPTALYDPSSTYESGEEPELPAVTMTPFAARQYTKWLSSLVGRDYRLPSEAEWFRAAAADDYAEPADLDAVAWYTDNADYVAHPVGEKEPNAWGLYDMLGNAAELVLDGVYAEGREAPSGRRLTWAEAVAWPRKGDGRIAKGGFYDAEADTVTLTARLVTEDSDWKASDPNLPASPWWYTDFPATGVGFRVVRPLDPIPDDIRAKVWDAEEESVARAVTERLREGRGKLGPIGADLPAVLQELGSPEVKKLMK